jgi:single-stranded-DNA-specific exonuclease
VEAQPEAQYDAPDVIARERAESWIFPATMTVVFQDDTLQGDIKRTVAPRICERMVRPTFVFSADSTGTLWGVGSTTPEVNLVEVLERVSARHPELRMARQELSAETGITLAPDMVEIFAKAFEEVVREMFSYR